MTSPSLLVVAGADASLDAQLGTELAEWNVAASGVDDQRELTVRVDDDDGLVAGLSGWTWGTCAGIAMVWVRSDSRGSGWGGQLLTAAESEAVARRCDRLVVTSLSFQAPGFYERHGYRECARVEHYPLDGVAEVYLVKALQVTD